MNKQELSKDDRLVVRIDKETKNQLMKRAEAEGKNASEILLGWIKDYLAEEPQLQPDIKQVYAELETLRNKLNFLEDEVTKKSAA
jgi:cell division protein FtsB